MNNSFRVRMLMREYNVRSGQGQGRREEKGKQENAVKGKHCGGKWEACNNGGHLGE